MRSKDISGRRNQCIYDVNGRVVYNATTAGTADLKSSLSEHYYHDVETVIAADRLDRGFSNLGTSNSVSFSLKGGYKISKTPGRFLNLYLEVRGIW